jgi:hypothetical protein
MKTTNGEVLGTDSLSSLGVFIDGLELRCTSCGESFMTLAPLASGKFPRRSHECPRGCNKVKASKTPAAA